MNREDKIKKLAYHFYLERKEKGEKGSELDDHLKAEKIITRNEAVISFIKIIAQLAVITGVFVAIWQGISTNKRADLNTELANRPFLSIEAPRWIITEGGIEGKWLESSISIKNYGSKPAEQVKDRNFRAIIFEIKTTEIKERIGNDKNILDERKRLILELMRLLVDFFEKNPDANNSEVSTYLSSLSPNSLELKDRAILFYKGVLLFNKLEVSRDLDDYKKGKGYLVFPTQPIPWQIRTDMSDGYLEGTEKEYLLVVYWGIKYKGFLKDKEYSTFYLGYYDAITTDIPKFELQGFQSWAMDETLKN